MCNDRPPERKLFMHRVLSLLLLAALVACQDLGPNQLLPPADGMGAFSDAMHNGNDRFYLLPPMVPNPKPTGIFNPMLQPRVAVCAINELNLDNEGKLKEAPGCNKPIANFDMQSGIIIPEGEEHYKVDWNTSTSHVQLETTYRILFYLSDQPTALLIGYADVQFASNMKGVKNIKTDETIALVDGETLPIKFRIEEGASCEGEVDCGEAVIGTEGGTVTTVDGYAGVFIPQYALDGDILITIRQVDPSDQDWGTCLPTGLRQEEGCYKFETEPALSEVNGDDVFKQKVTVAICLDPNALRPDNLTLHKYTPDTTAGVLELEGTEQTFLDCGGFMPFGYAAVSGGALDRLASLTGRFLSPVASLVFPRNAYATDLGRGGLTDAFTYMGWAEPAHLSGGNEVQAVSPAGAILEPVIQAMTAHNHGNAAPVAASGATLRFDYSVDGVQVAPGFQPASLVTDANGQATPSWQLKLSPGIHTLSVSTRGEANGSVVPDPTTILVLETTVVAVGEEDAVCGVNDLECESLIIGTGGGTVVTPSGHAGVFIPEDALNGDIRITVKRVAPVDGKCLPTGLRQAEGCYEFETHPSLADVNAGGTFNFPVTVGVCLDPAATRRDKFTLHKYHDPVQGVVELPGAPAGFLDCDDFNTSGALSQAEGPLQWLASARRRILSPAVGFLSPRLAYATDLGRGGLTDAFSLMGWAEPVELNLSGGNFSPTASPGAKFTLQVKAITTHNHETLPKQSNDTVLYAEYTDPIGTTTVLGPFNSGNAATTGIGWQLTQAVGTHTLSITTRGKVDGQLVPDPTVPLVLKVLAQ
jgi:hypothetical protein